MQPGTRFWVAGPDGKPYGPYELVTLQAYIDEGRVDPSAMVCADGEQVWMAATKVPGLRIPPPMPNVIDVHAPPVDTALGILVPIGVEPICLAASWVAIAGLLIPLLGPVAIVLGIIGLRRVAGPPPRRGRGRAITAIVMGALESTCVGIGIAVAVSSAMR